MLGASPFGVPVSVPLAIRSRRGLCCLALGDSVQKTLLAHASHCELEEPATCQAYEPSAGEGAKNSSWCEFFHWP
jgi:hypothetical protein